MPQKYSCFCCPRWHDCSAGYTIDYGYVVYIQHSNNYLSVYKYNSGILKTGDKVSGEVKNSRDSCGKMVILKTIMCGRISIVAYGSVVRPEKIYHFSNPDSLKIHFILYLCKVKLRFDLLKPNEKQLAILGSTGSIELNIRSCRREYPDLFEVYTLTANNNVDLLDRTGQTF